MIFEEKTVDSEYMFEGELVNVRRDIVTVPCGTGVREVVEHCGGVAMCVLTPEGNIVMERQYRYAVGKPVYEIPAGKLERDEDPEPAALREVREETGYEVKNIRFLTSVYPSVGFSNEKLSFYLCTELEKGETHYDPDEVMELEERPIEDIYSAVMRGEIEDSKTCIAVLMTMELIRNGELEGYLK